MAAPTVPRSRGAFSGPGWNYDRIRRWDVLDGMSHETLVLALAKSNKKHVAALRYLFGQQKKLAREVAELQAANKVLVAACGALYAELAPETGNPNSLDEMLARLLGKIEANPDKDGLILKPADQLLKAAEDAAASLGKSGAEDAGGDLKRT